MNFFDRFSVDGLLAMLYSLPGILLAISFHEFAHAYSAYKLGDDTARLSGRMTISPLAHIDVAGFLLLILAGFGWAKPVPVNTARLKYGRYGDLIVSLAGVVTNFILAFVVLLILLLLIALNISLNEIVFNIFSYAIYINLALCVFNLIPIPPLDGYRVVRALTVGPWGSNAFLSFVERYGFIILIVLAVSDTTSS
ncbi:MAG TPA: site-2 protease family protein, partial [Clostridia bacterium]|nr:site-2 protease family protein [Clostridia bacterium]